MVRDLYVAAARPADAGALVALQASIYREGRWFVGDGPVSAATLEHRLRLLDPERSLCLLAKDTAALNAPLWGWLELHRHHPSRLRHVATLTLAVAAAARQRGVASALLRESFLWAERVAVEKVQLSVREHNHAALALYARHGFELEGRERRQVREGDRYEDTLTMAKFLPPRARARP